MGLPRDFWDKANRQRKVWQEKKVQSGPSPIGKVVRRLVAQHRRRKAEDRLREAEEEGRIRKEFEALIDAQWRAFVVPPLLKEWLDAEAIDIPSLFQAVHACLGDRPIRTSSTPFIFWKYCLAVEKAIRKGKPWGGLNGSKKLDPKALDWLLKFKKGQMRK
jgi:hypothetical protein